MATVREWLDSHSLESIQVEPGFASQPWAPNEHDRQAAWLLYTEMRTRVVTQPLHFRSGDEAAALDSIYQLFGISRQAMMTGAQEDQNCRLFANLTTVVLNQVVRPFTAKWHKRNTTGRMSYEDDCHEFRLELNRLQETLRPFQSALGAMAEGADFVKGTESGMVVAAQRADDRQGGSETEKTTCAWESAEQAVVAEVKADQASKWPTTSWDRRARALDAIEIELPGRTAFSDAVPVAVQQDIREAEREEITRRRVAVNANRDDANLDRHEPRRKHLQVPSETQPELTDLTGLAISGGGIRSATFSLGAIQRLAEQGVLSEFDYLSTVSGGGYTGSFLSSYLNTPNPEVGVERGNFPFRTGRPIESAAMQSIRNHGKYLVFGGLRKLQMFGLAILGVVTNLVVLSSLVVAAVLATKWLIGDQLMAVCTDGAGPRLLTGPFVALWWTTLAAAVGLSGLLSMVYTVGSWMPNSRRFDRFTRLYEGASLLAFVVFLATTAFNALPFLAYGFHQIYPDLDEKQIGAVDWVVLGAGLTSFLSPLLGLIQKLGKWVLPVFMLLLGLSGPVILFGAYFVLLERFVIQPSPDQSSWYWLGGMLGFPLAYGLFLLNINFNSPHRFYRNRLSDAFLLKPPPEFSTDAGQPQDHVQTNDRQMLSRLREHRKEVPYHLINATLNTPASADPALRGRKSDFFLFSQRYCGSALSGYHPTRSIERLDGHVNLGTAMSISAAAVAPQMGTMPFGSAAFLLTLLNIRLGYWLRNPGRIVVWDLVTRWLHVPSVLYLYREMFSRVDEKTPFINLSDGGHLENLGMYELLRRRCKFIVAIEGEADPQMRCGSLMKLIRKASIDLGVTVNFEIDDFQLQDNGMARSCFQVGVIDYGPRPQGAAPDSDTAEAQPAKNHDMGILIYLKNAMIGNESVALKDYRLNNPPFPHQSTADQFFDEDQFESFRALGYHVAGEAMRAELFGGKTPDPLDLQQWADVLVRNIFSD